MPPCRYTPLINKAGPEIFHWVHFSWEIIQNSSHFLTWKSIFYTNPSFLKLHYYSLVCGMIIHQAFWVLITAVITPVKNSNAIYRISLWKKSRTFSPKNGHHFDKKSKILCYIKIIVSLRIIFWQVISIISNFREFALLLEHKNCAKSSPVAIILKLSC